MPHDPAVYLAVITGAGGWIALIIKHWISKDDRKMDEGTEIRAELRATVKDLETRLALERQECDKKMDQLRTDLDNWQNKYYSDTSKIEKEKRDFTLEIDALKYQINDIKVRFLPNEMKDRYK